METNTVDNRFGTLILLEDVVIPMNYNPATCVDEYVSKMEAYERTGYLDDDLNSKNYPTATDLLVPGKTYTVGWIPVLKTVTIDDCLVELSRHNALLVGAQGLSVVDREKLPQGVVYFSLDKKNKLWEDLTGQHRIPIIEPIENDGDFTYSLLHFSSTLSADNALIYVREKQV